MSILKTMSQIFFLPDKQRETFAPIFIRSAPIRLYFYRFAQKQSSLYDETPQGIPEKSWLL